MRLASTVSLKVSPSPSNDQGRSVVASASLVVGAIEQAVLEGAVGVLLRYLNPLGDGHDGHHAADDGRLKS